ncbi:hypothetical protein M5K25_026978 [Dendrobium thyrsiflorum]|uniref:Uncharacterized protein n=1 Tax=Dendrobium thyrsiflorum TaxID=117978 RepID=A0ABD0TYS6_DENTH
MADPEHDHGFVFDVHGRTDLLQSTFFDLNLEIDDTVDDYVDHILFTLVPSVEEHLPFGHWRLIGRPPTSGYFSGSSSGCFSGELYRRHLLSRSGITRISYTLLPLKHHFYERE